MSVTLSDEQEQAMAAIDAFVADSTQKYFVLHGLAGTGKTTLLAHVAQQYDYAALCCPTGKAASVIRRRTGLPAQTIHSYFYRLKEKIKDKAGHEVLVFEPIDINLRSGLVLLDESSMISDVLANDILRTGAGVIACGDPGQLPPVKGEQFFCRADFTLREIHRQALESPIIRQAHRVREGRRYMADGDAFRVAADGTDADLLNADVVLCWTNNTRNHMNGKCRRIRGYWQSYPQPDEPLVCLKSAAQYGVFNGGIYSLLEPFRQSDTSITLDVDGTVTTIPNVNFRGVTSSLKPGVEATTSFDFGYRMTVHKAQGSEWDSVVLIDEYNRTDFRREWLYTGVTRAAQRILVVR
jgi:ATP-dependent exoDNAse (exonuclease V) alpha subunit